MSFNAFDISASALYAQRVKLDTVASNIANVNTTRNPDGTAGPYKRKEVVFSAIYQDALNQDNTSGNFMNPGTLKGGISLNSPNTATGVTVDQISEDQTPGRKTYNPGHPDADQDGFVAMPNVNIVTEMVDMIAASRAYEANITTMDTAKNMLSSALRI